MFGYPAHLLPDQRLHALVARASPGGALLPPLSADAVVLMLPLQVVLPEDISSAAARRHKPPSHFNVHVFLNFKEGVGGGVFH